MKIQWTSPAVSDLESIREYISKDSVFYANRFIDKIFDSVEILAEQPEMGNYLMLYLARTKTKR
jgi:plasmid stabilization system protein ParE